MAGCISKNAGNAPGQTAAQPQAVTTEQPVGPGSSQVTPATDVSSISPDQGLVPDDPGNVIDQSETFNATQETNLTPDSVHLGDILP